MKVYTRYQECCQRDFARISILGESGSELSYLIPESRNFAEVKKLSDDIKTPWLKATLKEIKNLPNNQNSLVEDPEKDYYVTPYMDV